MQTMPSFVYLIPALMLFGLGKVPAVFATVIYAIVPTIRLTDLGIRNVDPFTVEAATAFGATERQLLFSVKIPLALPSIMAGINQTTMMALSMVVISSMIGARGLGENVLLGIQKLDVGQGFTAGLAIVLLAIIIDRITQEFGKNWINKMNNTKVEFKNIYKIFEKFAPGDLNLIKSGMSKKKLLEEKKLNLGINNLSLKINENEFFVIMGLSGSGKSTLIRHINGLIEASDGQVLIDGTDVTHLKDEEIINLRRHTVSMVFQKFGLLPHKTVRENVEFGLRIRRDEEEKIISQAQKWIDTVGLTGYEDAFPKNLSGGMQQRVGIARAAATETEILIMDEPFSALDPLIRTEMQDVVLELKTKMKKTVIFVTHDLEEAVRLADRMAILKDGELIQVGTPEEIINSPNSNYVKKFVDGVNLSS